MDQSQYRNMFKFVTFSLEGVFSRRRCAEASTVVGRFLTKVVVEPPVGDVLSDLNAESVSQLEGILDWYADNIEGLLAKQRALTSTHTLLNGYNVVVSIDENKDVN